MATYEIVEVVPIEMMDGIYRVGGTRVTLDSLIYAFHRGATAEEIAQQFPSVSLADTYAVIAYYLRNRQEVDDYLEERIQTATEMRIMLEQQFDPSGIRERLLARQTFLGD